MRFNPGASSMSLAWSTARHRHPGRGIIASPHRSAPDRFFPASIPRSRLIHASCQPAEESKQISLQERRAAATALAAFLREKKGFNPSEASGIRRGSPLFAKKLAILARSSAPAAVLHAEKLNVGEAVLESLGGSPEWAEAMLPRLQLDDERIQCIPRIAQKLENVGLARKKMWVLFDSNEGLWGSSPAEVEASISALHQLVSSKELVRMIECCPLLLGQGAEELRKALIASLSELQLGPKHIYNLVNLFQVSPRPVNLMLQELGLRSGDARQLLISNPLSVLEVVNSSLASTKGWFLKQGVDERVFWRLAVQNPAAGCRSPGILQEQLELMERSGLSHSEALEMLVKHSQVLPSSGLLGPKLEYLVGVMEYRAQMLLACPRYLRCSLEGNMKPRHQLVEWLVKQGRMVKPGLPTYLLMSEEAFLQAHDSLHEQALEVYKSKRPEVLSSASDAEELSQDVQLSGTESVLSAETRVELQIHDAVTELSLSETSSAEFQEVSSGISAGAASGAEEKALSDHSDKLDLEVQDSSSGTQARDPVELRVSTRVEAAAAAPEKLLRDLSSEVELEASEESPREDDEPSNSEATGVSGKCPQEAFAVTDEFPAEESPRDDEPEAAGASGKCLQKASVVTDASPAEAPPPVHETSGNSSSAESAVFAPASETLRETPETQARELGASPGTPELVDFKTGAATSQTPVPPEPEVKALEQPGESKLQPARGLAGEATSSRESQPAANANATANAPQANEQPESKQEEPVATDYKAKEIRKTGVLGFFRSIFSGF